jgi:hypothetical protein
MTACKVLRGTNTTSPGGSPIAARTASPGRSLTGKQWRTVCTHHRTHRIAGGSPITASSGGSLITAHTASPGLIVGCVNGLCRRFAHHISEDIKRRFAGGAVLGTTTAAMSATTTGAMSATTTAAMSATAIGAMSATTTVR